MRKLALLVAGALGAALPARDARAFCGFYVSGAEASLYNNATEVALMRDGVRTVLSMANNYQGPPEDFAMVVPVPVVLHEENVKTLPAELFAKLDKLAAPRLVEYWEQDPCGPVGGGEIQLTGPLAGAPAVRRMSRSARHYGVKIEARFSVAEYDVLILSARDALGLDAFLRARGYRIPAGAEPYLRPYVAGGSKFFVARVDVRKVRFEDGQAMLSPLRFHYDADTFGLPVRLGLINSSGAQDLIVHVIGRARYEVANYDNVAIPTNLDVHDAVRGQLGAFYAALFDHVVARRPRAVVTEYAWSTGSCDPCPTPPLTPSELASLGADVLPSVADAVASGEVPPDFARNLTLTRLHARYGKDSLGEDLVFRAAPPITGGRGVPSPTADLPHGAAPADHNDFQGRYLIRHPWTGPVACESPHRGVWGGPWTQDQQPDPSIPVASRTAFAPRGSVHLGALLARGERDLDEGEPRLPPGPFEPPKWPRIEGRGCAGCAVTSGEGALPAGALAAAATAALIGRRRRRIRAKTP